MTGSLEDTFAPPRTAAMGFVEEGREEEEEEEPREEGMTESRYLISLLISRPATLGPLMRGATPAERMRYVHNNACSGEITERMQW